jgi:hypothetical protein
MLTKTKTGKWLLNWARWRSLVSYENKLFKENDVGGNVLKEQQHLFEKFYYKKEGEETN